MNLSARLGTAANMGLLRTRASRQPLIKGNLLLLQVQALIVSAVAATLSFLLGIIVPSRAKMPMEMPQDSPPSDGSKNATTRFLLALTSRALTVRLEPSDSIPVRSWGYRFRE